MNVIIIIYWFRCTQSSKHDNNTSAHIILLVIIATIINFYYKSKILTFFQKSRLFNVVYFIRVVKFQTFLFDKHRHDDDSRTLRTGQPTTQNLALLTFWFKYRSAENVSTKCRIAIKYTIFFYSLAASIIHVK